MTTPTVTQCNQTSESIDDMSFAEYCQSQTPPHSPPQHSPPSPPVPPHLDNLIDEDETRDRYVVHQRPTDYCVPIFLACAICLAMCLRMGTFIY
uniref:Uncharacterized protein n=1 Tax=viral metagenome TaxID=1070528 RepID=A0A6C0BKT4_9ZZZZ